MNLETIKTDNNSLKCIVDFLLKECEKDTDLKEKIKKCSDTDLTELWQYLKKKAEPFAEKGVACIEDKDVFNWTKEYFLDWDNIQAEKQKIFEEQKKRNEEHDKEIKELAEKQETKSTPSLKTTKKKEEKAKSFDLFDLMAEMSDEDKDLLSVLDV